MNGLLYQLGANYRNFQLFLYVTQFILYSIVIYRCMKFSPIRANMPLAIICWGVILIISTFIYSNNIGKTVKALIHVLGIVVIYVIAGYIVCNKSDRQKKVLSKLLAILFMANIIIVLIFKKGLLEYDWRGGTYLFGGKFTTFYVYYVFGCILILQQKRIRLMSFVLYISIGIVLTSIIDCSTGTVCLLFTVILFLLRDFIIKIKPWMIITAICVVAILLTTSQIIFDNRLISRFITVYLNRSSTMTGRYDIYKQFYEIIKNNFIIGSGYESQLIINTEINGVIGYTNAQNALLETIYQSGIAGAALVLAQIYYSWPSSNSVYVNIILVMFIMGMIVCSFVEITFNYYFYILLGISHFLKVKESSNNE